MPILRPHDPEAPLAQGDVLKDIFFAIGGADGGAIDVEGPSHALVLSRHCNALRDERVVVAAIEQRSFASDGLSKLETLDDWRRFFAGVRDGREYPDQFYLGEFEGSPGQRFVAKLDSVHMITVPSEKDVEARKRWIGTHRVYHLTEEFFRDLHSRIFSAFAPLGFDDHAWFSDTDLDLVVSQGRAELARLKAERDVAYAEFLRLQTEGKDVKGKEKGIANREETIQKRERALTPYETELARRQRKP